MRRLLRTILREPLVHFLALGALIFAANWALHPAAAPDDHRIVVSGPDIARIRALYAQQWGAPPDPADMPNLIDNYIRSEVLFREGSALGLGADDSVMRNRVVQKMEFLLQDASSIPQPGDAEIAAWFQAHADAYRTPEQVAFTQLYFSSSLRGGRAEADAGAALAQLRSTGAPDRGDPFMLAADPAPRSQGDVARDFGPDFAAALFALPTGAWQGPLRSPFGFHLVRVTERMPPRLPALAEIRNRVHDDLMAERLRLAADAAYARVRARYQVEVTPTSDSPAKAAAMASP